MQRLRPLILLLAALAALALTAAPALAGPRITELPLRAEFALPNGIAAGPDGALWVTDSSLGRVWHITTKGKITSQDLGDMPTGIVSAGGALWIADSSDDQIVRLGTDGTQTPYTLDRGAFPTSIVEGPDGAIWFTETHGDKIGRVAPDGTIAEYPLATAGAFATDITVGPDGALWFSEESGNKVGRVTTDGVVTEFELPYAEPLPGPIVVADGALYVALRNTNIVAKLNTDGEVIGELPLPSENANPVDMVLGPRCGSPALGAGSRHDARRHGDARVPRAQRRPRRAGLRVRRRAVDQRGGRRPGRAPGHRLRPARGGRRHDVHREGRPVREPRGRDVHRCRPQRPRA